MLRPSFFAGMVIAAVVSTVSVMRAADAPASPAEKPATALSTAQGYLESFKDKKGVQAVMANWDFRAVCVGIFGSAWDKTKEQDQSRAAEMMELTVVAIMANPQVNDLLAKSKVDHWEEEAPNGDLTRVNFMVHFPRELVAAGKSPDVPNTLVLRKAGSKWMIVDGGNNGTLLVQGLAGEYKKNADMTPLQYANELFTLIQKKMGSNNSNSLDSKAVNR